MYAANFTCVPKDSSEYSVCSRVAINEFFLVEIEYFGADVFSRIEQTVRNDV